MLLQWTSISHSLNNNPCWRSACKEDCDLSYLGWIQRYNTQTKTPSLPTPTVFLQLRMPASGTGGCLNLRNPVQRASITTELERKGF